MKTFMANPAKIDRNGMLLMQKADTGPPGIRNCQGFKRKEQTGVHTPY